MYTKYAYILTHFFTTFQKNLRLCYVWFKVTIALFLIDLGILGGSIYWDLVGIEDYVVNGAGIIYSLYELWVVFAFTAEIKSQKEIGHTLNTTMTVWVGKNKRAHDHGITTNFLKSFLKWDFFNYFCMKDEWMILIRW